MRLITWLAIGLIMVLAAADLKLAALLFGLTMSELSADMARTVAGLLKAAMTAMR